MERVDKTDKSFILQFGASPSRTIPALFVSTLGLNDCLLLTVKRNNLKTDDPVISIQHALII